MSPAPAFNPDRSSKTISATGLPESIIFYCKDCREITGVNRVGRQFVYTCKKCGTKNVAFGTNKSIAGFFHLEEKNEISSSK